MLLLLADVDGQCSAAPKIFFQNPPNYIIIFNIFHYLFLSNFQFLPMQPPTPFTALHPIAPLFSLFIHLFLNRSQQDFLIAPVFPSPFVGILAFPFPAPCG